MMINLHLDSWKSLGRVLSAHAGLTIQWEEGFKPRTDGTVVFCQRPQPQWSEEEVVRWAGSLFHEIGHNMPDMRDCFTLVRDRDIDMGSFLGFLINLLDDYRQEHYQYGRYEGRDNALSQSQGHYRAKTDSWCVTPPTEEKALKRAEIVQTMLLFDTKLRTQWQPHVIGAPEKLSEALSPSPRVIAWLEQLEAYRASYALLSDCTAEEEFTLLQEILREVFNESPEELVKEAQQSSADAREAADGEGSEEDAAEGSGGDKQAKGASSEERGEGEKGGWTRYRDLLSHSHAERVGEGKMGSKISYTDAWDHTGFQCRDGEIVDSFTISGVAGEANTSPLGNVVRKLLLMQTQASWEGGYKHGKLDKKNLFKMGMGADNAWRRPLDQPALQVAVSLLVDCSGSMSGSKFASASRATLSLHSALASNNIPMEVVGFTYRSNPVHYLFRKFGEKLSQQALAERLGSSSVDMGCNSDGESVLFCYDRIVKRKEERKVIIVLSDGSPNAGYGTDDAYTFTKDVVSSVEASPVEIYGIGIEDRNVEKIYKEHYVIEDDCELEQCLLSLIKQKLIRR